MLPCSWEKASLTFYPLTALEQKDLTNVRDEVQIINRKWSAHFCFIWILKEIDVVNSHNYRNILSKFLDNTNFWGQDRNIQLAVYEKMLARRTETLLGRSYCLPTPTSRILPHQSFRQTSTHPWKKLHFDSGSVPSCPVVKSIW